MSIARHLSPPLHRLAVRTVYGLLNLLQPPGLPATGATLHLNACFHTEQLDDDRVFADLLAFCREFRALTGVASWQCVMTPSCPQVRDRLKVKGFSPAAYGERVQQLAEVAEIGYHGHFFAADGKPLAGGRFRIDEARDQIEAELAWLDGLGLAPLIYTAGWWLADPDLLTLLAAKGFRLDCSTRGGQGGTFGDKYPGDLPPVGERFELIPGLTEIGSLPYFAMPWPRYVRTLMQLMPEVGQRPHWAVLPLHDYSLRDSGGEELRIVARLARLPYVRWLTLNEALDELPASRPAADGTGTGQVAPDGMGPSGADWG